MTAHGKSSLFIGDLSIFCSEAEIESAFSVYGDIVEIKIMRSEETSRNLSYGFIKFVSSSSAKKAMSEMNGVLLCGRPLRIRWASYKNKQNQKDGKSSDVVETSPIHVSFISYQTDRLVTEESLRYLFSNYGSVIDASIKKSIIDKDLNRQSGYGFVHFAITHEGVESAIFAASALNDMTVENINYKCSISHNLSRRLSGDPTIRDLHERKSSLPCRSDFIEHNQFVTEAGYSCSDSNVFGFSAPSGSNAFVGHGQVVGTDFGQPSQGIAFSQIPSNGVGGFIVVPSSKLVTTTVMPIGSVAANASPIPIHQMLHSPMSSLSSVSTEALIDDAICPNYLFYSPNPMQFIFPGSPHASNVSVLNGSCVDNFHNFYNRPYSAVHDSSLLSYGQMTLDRNVTSQNSVLCGMDQRVTAGLLNRNAIRVTCNKPPSRPSRNIINKIRSKLDLETKNADSVRHSADSDAGVGP